MSDFEMYEYTEPEADEMALGLVWDAMMEQRPGPEKELLTRVYSRLTEAVDNLNDWNAGRDRNGCAECSRSFGPWYDGPCEHN